MCLVEQAAHCRQETHVGHSIRLVHHDLADAVEAQCAHRQQILQAAGAGDDHFDAGRERLALGPVADPAVHRHDVVASDARERAQLGGDLGGELTSRSEHQRGGVAALRWLEVRHQRDAEGKCLARPCRGATHHVAPAERVGDHCGLDWGGHDDPCRTQARGKVGRHAQRAESRCRHTETSCRWSAEATGTRSVCASAVGVNAGAGHASGAPRQPGSEPDDHMGRSLRPRWR
jgi:hypothetical protein